MNVFQEILAGVAEVRDARGAVAVFARNVADYLRAAKDNASAVGDLADILARGADTVADHVMANVPTVVAHVDADGAQAIVPADMAATIRDAVAETLGSAPQPEHVHDAVKAAITGSLPAIADAVAARIALPPETPPAS